MSTLTAKYFRWRAGELWLRRDVIGLESKVVLESVNVTLTLKEIYEPVSFEPELTQE